MSADSNFKAEFFNELERIKKKQVQREELNQEEMSFLYICSILEEE